MNALTLAPSGSEAVPVDMSRMSWQSQPDGSEKLLPYFTFDRNGTIRDREGLPQTAAGTITPLGFVEVLGTFGASHSCQSLMHSAGIGIGMAAVAWGMASGEAASTAGRDTVLALMADACTGWEDQGVEGYAVEAFCIAEHELAPALERVAVRLATDLDFTAKFAQARAIMNAACVYFPWYRGDGKIPG